MDSRNSSFAKSISESRGSSKRSMTVGDRTVKKDESRRYQSADESIKVSLKAEKDVNDTRHLSSCSAKEQERQSDRKKGIVYREEIKMKNLLQSQGGGLYWDIREQNHVIKGVDKSTPEETTQRKEHRRTPKKNESRRYQSADESINVSLKAEKGVNDTQHLSGSSAKEQEGQSDSKRAAGIVYSEEIKIKKLLQSQGGGLYWDIREQNHVIKGVGKTTPVETTQRKEHRLKFTPLPDSHSPTLDSLLCFPAYQYGAPKI